MRLRSRAALTMLLACAGAQGQVDTSAWPTVRMEVLALDKKGAALPLTAEMVTVTEGGRPVKVQSLATATESQSVCVVVDSSGSMYDRISSVKAAAARIANALPAGDEICLVDFNGESHVDAELTRNRDRVKNGLSYVVARGTSSLFDTLVATANYLRRNAANPSRAIVLLTDGDDNVSKIDLAGAIAGLYKGGAPTVHVLRLASAEQQFQAEVAQGEKTLLALTRATGGVAYFPKKNGELEASVDELCRAMGNRVTISYETAAPARDSGERRVSVQLDKAHQKQKAAIFAAEGYYAPSH